MNKIKIGILGSDGRMGRDIVSQIGKFKKLELSNLCEEKGHRNLGKSVNGVLIRDDLEILVKESDVIIDFTCPSSTLKLLRGIDKYKSNVSVVTGTTGYKSKEERNFQELITGKRVLRAFNMSFGINLLGNLVENAAKNLTENSDVEISETHHNKKKDLPSGTALMLAEFIGKGNKKFKKIKYREKGHNNVRKKFEIGFSSIRGGDVIGEHTVFFFLEGERMEFTHKADSRNIFSVGALRAAEWIYGKKPGLYSMIDMIK